MDATNDKLSTWEGWNSNIKHFGLELQIPYAQHLLEGTKSIETRGYPIPPALLSKRIDVLESKKGVVGVSAVADKVILTTRSCTNDDDDDDARKLCRKGWCTITQCFRYTTAEQFEADAKKHLVDNTSGYGWNDTKPMYGWIVGTYGLHEEERMEDERVEYIAERRMRSLFEITKECRPL